MDLETHPTATATSRLSAGINTRVTRLLPRGEHLQIFADAAFTQLPERQAWFKQARCILKRGQAAKKLDQMHALSKKMRGASRSIMASQIQYFTKCHQWGRLSYSLLTAMKMPIGSGAIESLIRSCG